MSLKQELQNLHNRQDTCQRKLDAAKGRGDNEMISKFTDEIAAIEKKIISAKGKQKYDISKEGKELKQMAFSREITKAEQADMGKLKKSVRGLIVVHPMTKLGKELQLKAMTGFAAKKF